MSLKDRRSVGPFQRLYSRTAVINVFRISWAVVLLWGEVGVYFWSLASCKWPDAALSASSEKPTHVLLVSDPQVRHPDVFGQEYTWRGLFRQFVFDLNLKKCWHATTHLKPHAIMFLGDMLASGKSTKDAAEYKEYALKFKSLFATNPPIPMYFITGNNDVGMGVHNAVTKDVRSHYLEAFGYFNQRILVRGHTFVCLDAPGLVEEDYQRSAHGVSYEQWKPVHDGPVQFVKTFNTDKHPVILLSHIPLSRPDTASCGPLREKGTIRRGVGHGYQNTLGKQTSSFLLSVLRPSIIFSGDNRDYCEYYHPITEPSSDSESRAPVREVTVKSFSMANHIRRPGFQLLSLTDPPSLPSPSHKSLADTPCLFPDQFAIYTNLYIPFAVITLLGLLLWNGHRVRRLRRAFLPAISTSSRSDSSGRSSGPTSPLQPLDSSIWSPYTPAVPVSPRSSLPPSLRTPNALSGPTLRTASRPTTPLGSPFLSPMIYQQEDEEEESMYPAQYAYRSPPLADEGWSPDHDQETQPSLDASSRSSYFLPTPGSQSAAHHRLSWTWTFEFAGRRRRMTIRPPLVSWSAFRDLLGLLEGMDADASLRRRGIVKSTVLDVFSIGWVAAFVWAFITWRMF